MDGTTATQSFGASRVSQNSIEMPLEALGFRKFHK